MENAEYVVTGWVITFGSLGVYWWWILRATKRAEASLPPEPERPPLGEPG